MSRQLVAPDSLRAYTAIAWYSGVLTRYFTRLVRITGAVWYGEIRTLEWTDCRPARAMTGSGIA